MKDLKLTLAGDTVTPGEAYVADTPGAAPCDFRCFRSGCGPEHRGAVDPNPSSGEKA
jgi:hypothetical protein